MRWRLPLFLCLALFAASSAAQTVYRWVDAQGRVQYSQTPPPEAADAEQKQVASDDRPASPERESYCGAVRDYAGRIGDAMRRGASRDAMIASARAIETD